MKQLGLFLRRHSYGVFAPLVLLLLFLSFWQHPLVSRVENLTVDWRLQNRPASGASTDPALLLVDIDQTSLDRFGGWPWPRNYHGDLISLVDPAKPSVVAFDILFSDRREERRDRFLAASVRQEQANQFLAESLKKSGKVVLSAFAQSGQGASQRPGTIDFGKTRPLGRVSGDLWAVPGIDDFNQALTPMALLRYESFFGFTDTSPMRADNVRRRMPLVVRVGGELYPSFVTQILMRHFRADPSAVRITLGGSLEIPREGAAPLRIPVNDQGEMLINYRPQLRFPSVPFVRALQDLYDNQYQAKPLPADFPSLENRILIVGATVPGLMELASTPLDSSVPPVYTHLQALNTILRGDHLRAVPMPVAAVAFLFISWITLIGLKKKHIGLTLGIPILALLLYLAISWQALAAHNLLIPVFWPFIGFATLHVGSFLLSWIEELRSKQQLRSVLGSYIAPSVMDQILKSEENLKLGGVSKPVTILFSDIRGFTTIAETMNEEALVTQLNEYFEQMVECVNHHQGTLHKYIGDAIMAAWGDVVARSPEEDARAAVRAALEMRTRLATLNERWSQENRPPFHIGIGLNHGNVLVGNIGATQRKEFTLIGDAVNLASRLEGVTKQFRCELIVGESVAQLLGSIFVLRPAGVLVVKGKTRPVRVHEVLEAADASPRLWPDSWVDRYTRGFNAFVARDFAKAAEDFAACLAERPGDYCTGLYLDQARAFLQTPPDAEWNGVVTLKDK